MQIKSFFNNTVSKLYLDVLNGYCKNDNNDDSLNIHFDSLELRSRTAFGTISLRCFECAELVAYSKIKSYGLEASPIILLTPELNLQNQIQYRFQVKLPNNLLQYHYSFRKRFDTTPTISTFNSLVEHGVSNSALIFGPSGAGKSYLMDKMVDLLNPTTNNLFIIDSDYAQRYYFKSYPETIISTSILPRFTSKSVLRIGDITHSENMETLISLLLSIFDSQDLPESSFVFINSGDEILKNIPLTSMKTLLSIASEKKLRLITSLQSVYNTIDNQSMKLLKDFCDRFYFTSYVNYSDLVASLLLEAKKQVNDSSGYSINRIDFNNASYIFQNIIKRKDVFFLGPQTQEFVGNN